MRFSLRLLVLLSLAGPAGAAEVVSLMRTADGRLLCRPLVVLGGPEGQGVTVAGGVVETFNGSGRMIECLPFDSARFGQWSGGRQRLAAGQRMLFTIPLAFRPGLDPARAQVVFRMVDAAGATTRVTRDYWLGEAPGQPPKAPAAGPLFEVHTVPDRLEGVRLGRSGRTAYGFQIQLQESNGVGVSLGAVDWLARAADGRPVAEGRLTAEALGTALGSTLVGPDSFRTLPAQQIVVDAGAEPQELLVRVAGKAAGSDLSALGRFALAPPQDRSAATRLQLPVRGVWHVVQGPGDGSSDSIDAYTWLLDRLDGRRQPYAGRGDSLGEHHAYDQPVYAPAAGVVIQATDLIADASTPLENGHFAGFTGLNHLVIDHGNGEQSYLAGLKQFSLRVRANQRVETGQELARVGCGDTGADRPALLYRLRRAQPAGTSLEARFDSWQLIAPGEPVSLPAAPEPGDIFRAN